MTETFIYLIAKRQNMNLRSYLRENVVNFNFRQLYHDYKSYLKSCPNCTETRKCFRHYIVFHLLSLFKSVYDIKYYINNDIITLIIYVNKTRFWTVQITENQIDVTTPSRIRISYKYHAEYRVDSYRFLRFNIMRKLYEYIELKDQ